MSNAAPSISPGPVTPSSKRTPFWRGPKLSQKLSPLAPIAGYQGCIALVPGPGAAAPLEVVMYVDQWQGQTDPTTGTITLGDGVIWTPPPGTIVLDVPRGFPFQNADEIGRWVRQLMPAGDGGRDGSVGGITSRP
jgi:hypothetical protein